MASNNLEVTAIYSSGETMVKETATCSDISSFKVIKLEGPFDENGNLVPAVDKTKRYAYIATLDKDVSAVNIKEVNWAVSYDNGNDEYKFEKIQGGRRYDKNRIWIYLQSEFASYEFTIHAYTSTIPVNGSSVTVSIDHSQYEADLKKGDRCNTPSNTTIVTDGTTPIEEKEYELEMGIRLHFLRYGFFAGDDHADQNAIGKKHELFDNQSQLIEYNEKYPKVKNFHCHLTELVPDGYIYIINPNKASTKQSFEYLITPNQNLRRIPWYVDPKKEDRRTFFGAKRRGLPIKEAPYHLVKYIKDKEEPPELYVSYSPVQWSKAFFEKMIADAQLRNERMSRVHCVGFEKSQTENGDKQYAYDGFSAAFTRDNEIGAARLKNKKKRISTHQARKRGENAELKEDMFIPLLDPVNSAREIADELAHKILNFKALVEAIQTGETQEEAYNRICEGGDVPKPDKEYRALYSLALTVYHMVYNEKSMIEMYDGGVEAPNSYWGELHHGEAYREWYEWGGNSSYKQNNVKTFGYAGIDPTKIEGLLGVQARKELRENIGALRNDLGNFISHNDFKIPLDDYLHNAKERQLEGRVMLSELLETLFTTTYEFDRHLLLQKDYVDTDPWKEKILDITDTQTAAHYQTGAQGSKAPDHNGTDPLYALLTPLLNVDEVLTNTHKIGKKLSSALKTKLKFESARVFITVKKSRGKYYSNWDDFVQIVVKKCNASLKVYNTEVIELSKKEFSTALQKALGNSYEVNTNFVHKGKYKGKKTDVLRLKKRSGAVKVISTKPGEHVLEIRVRTKTTEENARDITKKRKASDKAAKVLNSKGFTGFIALLDLYNMYGTISKFGEGNYTRDFANLADASIKLTESGLALGKAFGLKTALDKNIITKRGTIVGTGTQLLGVISSVATAAMCVWDATEAFGKRDTDAAVGYSMAAVAFGVSAYAGYTAFVTGAAAAGPLGWIAAIVGTGIYVFVIMTSDTPIETYFKQFILSDKYSWALGSRTPMQYNHSLVNNKERLVTGKYQKNMMYPRDAEATLMNLVVCPYVTLKPVVVPGPRPENTPKTVPKVKIIQSITAQLRFYKFLNDADSIEILPYFIPDGLRAIKRGAKPVLLKKITVNQYKDNVEVHVNFVNQRVWLPTQFIMAIRLEIDADQNLYFPYDNRQSQAVYLAIKVDLFAVFKGISDEYNEAPAFLTKEQLFLEESWS